MAEVTALPTVYEIFEMDGSTSLFIHWKNYLPALLRMDVAQELVSAEHWICKKPVMGTAEVRARTLRWNRWHHTENQRYKFSNRWHAATPYTPKVLRLQSWLNERMAAPCAEHKVPWRKANSVLISRYDLPEHAIAPHADNEAGLGPQPAIVSATLGWGRTMMLKRMTEKERQKEWARRGRDFVPNPNYHSETIVLELNSGDVVLMAGSAQDFWYHAVPPAVQAPAQGPTVRYNLTYRYFDGP